MSDNVIDMKSRRRATDHDDNAAQKKDAKQKRLGEARDIAARLRRTHRTDPSDRAIFAANLARMCDEVDPNGKTPLLAIFETAFGKDFDAKYKKRKRFVCAAAEETPSEGFAAHGADYVDLAEATAKIVLQGQPTHAITQAKHRAILQLIEGSSLDDLRPPEARLKDEAVASLLECFDQMVRNVETEVDLNAMRAVVEYNAVSAVIDSDGNVQRLVPIETHEDRWPARQVDESEEA